MRTILLSALIIFLLPSINYGQANTSLSNLIQTSINRDLLPNVTNVHNLGSLGSNWEILYLDSGIYLKKKLFIHKSGTQTVFIGEGAGSSITTAVGDVGIGYQALQKNTTGNLNTAVGYGALSLNKTGSYNCAFGVYALYNNAGNDNVAIGYGSLYSNNSGHDNIGIGKYVMYANTTGYQNTAAGNLALNANNTGYQNTAIGYYALQFNSSGDNNTAGGNYALANNRTASNNTAYGSAALTSNQYGESNTGVGSSSLFSNTNGLFNVGIGSASLATNTSGNNNTAVGSGDMQLNSTGSDNTAIGNMALYSNTDSYNTAVGYQSLFNNVSGYNNTAVGMQADVTSSNFVNATAIGAQAKVNASNKIRLGDGGITVVESNAGSWTVSDGRFKNNITENVKGLEFIKLLKPVTYNFDTRKFEEFLMQNYPDSIKKKRLAEMDKNATTKASSILQSGFIAEDVEEAVKKSGYNFNGVHVPESSSDNWSLSYEKLTVPLVKAVQELSAMNDAKDAKIDTLQNQLNDLRTLVLSIQQKQNQCSPCSASVSEQTQSQSVVLSNASSIQQNIPNPFTHTTNIAYSLNQKFISAQIVITDKSGRTIKAINISGNKGNVAVDALTLTSGAYQYSLIIDGRLLDTKQMVFAK